MRAIESGTGAPWRNVRNELDRMHLVTMETAEGRVAQRSTTTTSQAEILRAPDIAEPGRLLDFELPAPHAWSQVSGSRSNTAPKLALVRSAWSVPTSGAAACPSTP